jgi:hypothetical protein
LSRTETADIGNFTCSVGSSHVRTVITLLRNGNPEKTSWEIVDEGSKGSMLQDGNYTRSGRTYMEGVCVPTEGCLEFVLFQKKEQLHCWWSCAFARIHPLSGLRSDARGRR